MENDILLSICVWDNARDEDKNPRKQAEDRTTGTVSKAEPRIRDTSGGSVVAPPLVHYPLIHCPIVQLFIVHQWPRHVVSVSARLIRALSFVASLHRPLTRVSRVTARAERVINYESKLTLFKRIVTHTQTILHSHDKVIDTRTSIVLTSTDWYLVVPDVSEFQII